MFKPAASLALMTLLRWQTAPALAAEVLNCPGQAADTSQVHFRDPAHPGTKKRPCSSWPGF